MTPRTMRILAGLLAVICCYGVAVGALLCVDSTRAAEGMDDILYLPNEKLLTHFTGGLNTVVADLLWLHCIQYTALEHRGPRHFTWLEHMLVTATRLDPYFVDVYRFGAIFLSALRADPDASLRLAEAGMRMNPRAWQLPYEAAMNYLLNKRDHPDARWYAAQYLSMSVATGRAISGVVNLAAKLQDEFDLTELEQEVWRDMLESEDAFLRELAARKLTEIQLREVCRILNQQMQVFKERFGRRASTLAELVEAGLLSYIPEDPLGGEFIIAADGRVYNTTLLDDEVIRVRNPIINAIDDYWNHHNHYPASLDVLVDMGYLDEIPRHPYLNRQWRYDPVTGVVE